LKRNNRRGRSFGRRFRQIRSFTPLHATMEIRDVDYYDTDTGVGQLTDEAVEKGRDWVSYLQL